MLDDLEVRTVLVPLSWNLWIGFYDESSHIIWPKYSARQNGTPQSTCNYVAVMSSQIYRLGLETIAFTPMLLQFDISLRMLYANRTSAHTKVHLRTFHTLQATRDSDHTNIRWSQQGLVATWAHRPVKLTNEHAINCLKLLQPRLSTLWALMSCSAMGYREQILSDATRTLVPKCMGRCTQDRSTIADLLSRLFVLFVGVNASWSCELMLRWPHMNIFVLKTQPPQSSTTQVKLVKLHAHSRLKQNLVSILYSLMAHCIQ